ncbi:UDP-N-acetylmuramate dehydrogenase [Aphanothece sacrum]|uniref:UDP-N-acetylenolpyruvoylglucosamine reductase n=1 Tax=Aphanothece sacrum FPU1 TaxID=1920663 RepID=A0A401INQ0_APHSA|nr:UDP-N-acetylmuramate dehydrogenase [Aphanothece sacrum]GBF82894.1 UDP-N-acetylenolpyruvoylglucosamine reductase [Aphanothece sacrum FPU1]GBF85972.1 UDP-N-acetylenolpyruvoylglucosamine reductase [Aphanothece sacrum FPU3]
MSLSLSCPPLSPIQLCASDYHIYPNVSLASHTSYRVGGKAEWYAAPRTWEDLQATFDWFQQQDLPLMLLGAGSNLLISDRGIDGLVLSTRHLRHRQVDMDSARITVAAGEPIAKVAWQVAKLGWRGLEWAVGIPGTVGGAVVMNAGAHNQSAADCLVSALVVSPNGTVATLTPEQLNYSYRTSALQGDQRLVIEATFQLQPGFTREEVMATTQNNLQQRKSSQPYDKPSCGSVFRNPTPHAAGWLIEELGLKGYRLGDAEVSQRHANFILNCGQATAEDIFRLIHHVQEQVESRWSVLLEPEVKILGEFSVL